MQVCKYPSGLPYTVLSDHDASYSYHILFTPSAINFTALSHRRKKPNKIKMLCKKYCALTVVAAVAELENTEVHTGR